MAAGSGAFLQGDGPYRNELGCRVDPVCRRRAGSHADRVSRCSWKVDVGPPSSDGSGSHEGNDGSQCPQEHLCMGFVRRNTQDEPAARMILFDEPVLRNRNGK